MSLAMFTLAATSLAGCADPQREPARQAIAAIDAELVAAGTAPSKYIPGELKDAQARLAALKQQYDAGKFGDVVHAAPDVLAAARSLAPAAAARAAELDQALREEWTQLAASMPAELGAVQSAMARVGAAAALPAGPGADRVRLAQQQAADASRLWDRAVTEAADGRLPEAVTLANQARTLARQVMALPGVGAAGSTVK